MFGLSLGGQLIQGSAQITWNCISQLTNILWCKFNNRRQPIMPRQRRRHHSRSRSRSHSHEKDRDVKRRKIDVYESPNHKRSVSPESDDNNETETNLTKEEIKQDLTETSVVISESESETSLEEKKRIKSNDESMEVSEEPNTPNNKTRKTSSTSKSENVTPKMVGKTPNRRLTPKQLQKKLESEKKRKQREEEKAERERQRLEEKEKREVEKTQRKEEKQKELEQKQKEKEEREEQRKREKEQKRIEEEKRKEQKRLEEEKKKEQKRVEREMKEEQKRKEEEEKKMKKLQELEEKTREKQREQEKKLKASAAFVSFFVPKKGENNENKKNEENSSIFMPFEVKTDMRLPPPRREPLKEEEKNDLIQLLENNLPEYSYLSDLKMKNPRTCPKTWPVEEDVWIVEDEDDLGETICEEKLKSERMKAKFLKFRENQRPAYYGTWRKKSNKITGRSPFAKEEEIFDYDVDSDDDWEEEEQGENLEVMSDEDKENEPENEDYEVDNEFFVPHGHLSDDEIDDEENARLDPETQKQKLKILKDAFEEDIKSKTQKLKPRAIGCIWYNKDGTNVEEAVNRYLQPLAAITNGPIEIKKRDFDNNLINGKKKTPFKEIPDNLMSVIVKLIHGNTMKKKEMVEEFLKHEHVKSDGFEISKADISRHISIMAKYSKKKACWIVKDEIASKLNIELSLIDEKL